MVLICVTKFVQYLAIYNNENLPNMIHIFLKYVQHFAKY